MSKNKVNCDTRVPVETKNRLEEIAKALGVKRADVQRAAFSKYITAYDAGEFDHIKEAQNGKETN